MSNDNAKLYFEQSARSQVRGWILNEMLRGAGYAAVVVLGTILLIYAIYLFGLLLPAESKQAPPPMPFSQIEAPAEVPTGAAIGQA